jgi:hypothetical protein
MPTLLTEQEKAAFLERHPEFLNLSGQEWLPDDGVIVRDDLLGCVFLFDKQDGTRIFAAVNDIWPHCVRQVITPPPSILDELLTFVGEASRRTGDLLTAAVWLLIGVLILQSGILRGIARG